MSGKYLARASALSLAMLLAACGGDENSTPIVNVNTGNDDTTNPSDDNQGGGTDSSDPGAETPPETSIYALGTGKSSTFTPGAISANIDTLTIGSDSSGTATLTLNVVDTSKNNALAKISDNNVTFASQCSVGKDWSTFDSTSVSGSEGKVSVVYTPTSQCVDNNDGKDVITARLNGSDDITATVALTLLDQGTAPSQTLGFFDGTTFNDKKIGVSRNTLVVGPMVDNVVELSLSLVDPSDNNSVIKGSADSISFTSVCQGSGLATVTPASIPASEGKVLATYSASAECLTSNGGIDTITARLSNNQGIEATETITLVEDETAIGFFNGSTFNAGQIQFTGSAIAGKSTPISVSIVDLGTPEPHSLIKSSQNNVDYRSTCSLAGWASFSPASISGAQGTAPTTYTPTEECVNNNDGKDTITARLNGNDVIIAEVDVTVVSGAANGTSIAFGAFTATPGDPTPSFKEGVIAISGQPIVAGTSAPISVSIVDPANGYALVKDSDTEVSFSSQCSLSTFATFNPANVSGSEGKVISTYTPLESCLDVNNGNDIIRATLKAGDLTFTAEKTITIQSQTSVPEVTLGAITAAPAALTIGESATISTKIVDPVTGDLVKQSGNSVTFSSLCVNGGEASFSQQTVSGSEGLVYTNYTPTQSCLQSTGGQDTITARLNGLDDVQESVIITLNAQPPAISPALGYIDGAGNFVSGKIEVSPSKNLIIADENLGQASVTLTVVDPANPGSPLVGLENNVTFFSACISAGWASMDNQTVATEAGEVRAIYTPGAQCVGDDTLYAKLNDDSEKLADVTFENTPKVIPPEPVIKVGSLDAGGTFQEGDIRVIEPALTLNPAGNASTDMIVNIQRDGVIESGASYAATFTSMCIDSGRASVTGTQTTQSGAILAKYNASQDCLGTDNVVVFLNDDSTLKASAQIAVSDTKLAIGSYDGAGLFVDNLAASKSVLDYNMEDEPSSDIRSVIAKVDDSGSFIDQVVGFQSNVEFFSTCIDSGLASVVTSGTTDSGELISTYKAQGCVGEDTVYGRIAGTNTIASTTIEMLPKQGQELALGYFDAGTFNSRVIGNTRSTALPLGVQTKLYLSIADAVTETQVKGQPLTVQLKSQCGEQANNTSPLSAESVSVSLGYIEILYTAQSCGSRTEDLVRAELTGVEGFSASAEAAIELAELPANSLTADLPDPNSIAPSFLSTDGRETTSTLKVQLKDNQGNGVSGETISFRLDNPDNTGSTDSAVLTPVNGGITDFNGFAKVEVKAAEGVDNVVFRIISSFTDSGGNLIETYSAPIAVNSKLPIQERFSLGTSNFAPDVQGKNGVQVQLTLLAADDQGNRIRGNTIVNFETYIGTAASKKQAGSINPECILDNDGRCTVTWESLNIFSTNEDQKLATVRAYTQGIHSDGTTGIIESSTQLLMTTSADIQVELTPNTITPAGGEFCAEAFVDILGNGGINVPPVGSTLEFEVTGGTLIPASSSSFTLGSSSALLDTPNTFEGCTFVEPDPTSTDPLRLTVTATPPAGSPDSATVVVP